MKLSTYRLLCRRQRVSGIFEFVDSSSLDIFRFQSTVDSCKDTEICFVW